MRIPRGVTTTNACVAKNPSMTLVLLEHGARGGYTLQGTINVAVPRGHPACARCIAMDNPPPCGYYSRMMTSESVLRRPELNSRARLCGGALWASIVCLQGATVKAISRNCVWRITLNSAP